MIDSSTAAAGKARDLVTAPELARILRVSPRTLERHRANGTGCTYIKIGGRVLYRLADVDQWLASSCRLSTSDITRSATIGPH